MNTRCDCFYTLLAKIKHASYSSSSAEYLSKYATQISILFCRTSGHLFMRARGDQYAVCAVGVGGTWMDGFINVKIYPVGWPEATRPVHTGSIGHGKRTKIYTSIYTSTPGI